MQNRSLLICGLEFDISLARAQPAMKENSFLFQNLLPQIDEIPYVFLKTNYSFIRLCSFIFCADIVSCYCANFPLVLKQVA